MVAIRRRILLLLACVAALSLSITPAAFAVAIDAQSSDAVVIGTVISSESRLDDATSRVLTDVTIAQGAQLDTVVMEGGEFGDRGTWTELFFPVAVGQGVAFSVSETAEGLAADAPPVAFGIEPTDSGLAISATLAGYASDGKHWRSSALPVGFWVNTAYAPAGALEAVTSAAQAWEDDAGSDMAFTYLGETTAVAADFSDNINVVDWGLNNGASGTLALCTISYGVTSQEIHEFSI